MSTFANEKDGKKKDRKQKDMNNKIDLFEASK